MTITIILPWPAPELNPNSRTHYRAKAALAKEARGYGYAVASVTDGGGSLPGYRGNIATRIIFYPPDNRGRDLDNAYASMKPYIDGLADALGINDKQLRPVTLDWCAVVAGGRVTVEITL